MNKTQPALEPKNATDMPGENVVEQPTRMEEFAKTGTAANWSGKYHGTMGYFKRKAGEWTNDTELKNSGTNEELLGKVHHLVGVVRKAKEETAAKINKTKSETKAICRKHGSRFIGVASDFLEDMKNALLK